MFQCFQFAGPENTVRFQPLLHFAQRRKVGLAITLAALLLHHHQPAFGQDLYVPGYGRPADVEVFRHGIQVQGTPGDQVNDLPACGVGYRLEYISSHQNYLCNQSVTNLWVTGRLQKYVWEQGMKCCRQMTGSLLYHLLRRSEEHTSELQS